MKIPVSVIVVTKNEEARIEKCLRPLNAFESVIVVDSRSTDKTCEIAARMGASVVDFQWNGQYPKKRQWCLDTLVLKHDWVFFVDADEVATQPLIQEIREMDFTAAGYFVQGQYIFEGHFLKHGLRNNKLALINRTKIAFPVVDDLDLPGMGEIEGHYQPILKSQGHIGQLENALLHDAYDNPATWDARHSRYAAWEAGMYARNAWPNDTRLIKRVFKALPFQPLLAFLHCYVLKAGFLDGARGFRFARSRFVYYRLISEASKNLASASGIPTPPPAPRSPARL